MSKQFEEKKFNIPKLNGISEKAIEIHLGLYAGYVKNANELLQEKEYNRRFPFEFDGMRNHEVYFAHFCATGASASGGEGFFSHDLSTETPLYKMIMEEWGDFDKWLNRFKSIALTRGVGWAIAYYDPTSKQLINSWVDEHHLGQLVGLSPILVLDMWEHAYFIDYTPAEKKKYIEAFFESLNWQNVEENFANAI